MAAALVAPSKGTGKKEGIIVVTSNTGELNLNELSFDDGKWNLGKQTNAALKKYVDSYLENTSDMSARKFLSSTDAKWQIFSKCHNALKKIVMSIGYRYAQLREDCQLRLEYNSEHYVHAEMKILDLLWRRDVVPIDGKHVFIGISMLCCAHCQKAIHAFNAGNPNGWKIIVYGGHGSEYEPNNWPGPQFLQEDETMRRMFFLQYEGGRPTFRRTKENLQKENIRPLHGTK